MVSYNYCRGHDVSDLGGYPMAPLFQERTQGRPPSHKELCVQLSYYNLQCMPREDRVNFLYVLTTTCITQLPLHTCMHVYYDMG